MQLRPSHFCYTFLLFLLFNIVFYILYGVTSKQADNSEALLPAFVNLLIWAGWFTVGVIMLVFFIKMLVSLQIGTTGLVILAILSILPCIGFIVALIYSDKATRVLKAAGIRRVGVFGAPGSAIRDFENS